MQIIVSTSIISSGRETPGLIVGINAMREVDPARPQRIVKEGAVVQALKDAKGNEVLIVMNPDEAREHGMLLVNAAYVAAGVHPPRIELKDAAAPPSPILIGGGA